MRSKTVALKRVKDKIGGFTLLIWSDDVWNADIFVYIDFWVLD